MAKKSKAGTGRGKLLTEPPSWLSVRAKKVWKQVGSVLSAGDVSDCLDEAILASFCESYAILQACSEQIDKDGLTTTDKNGCVRKHPLLVPLGQARSAIVKLSTELGFSPYARQRMDLVVGDPDDEA